MCFSLWLGHVEKQHQYPIKYLQPIANKALFDSLTPHKLFIPTLMSYSVFLVWFYLVYSIGEHVYCVLHSLEFIFQLAVALPQI